MGVWHYGICHTCKQRVSLTKGLWVLDPRLGHVDLQKVQELERLAIEPHVACATSLFMAFVMLHAKHSIEVVADNSDDDDTWEEYESVMQSQWDHPFDHRLETPRDTPPQGHS